MGENFYHRISLVNIAAALVCVAFALCLLPATGLADTPKLDQLKQGVATAQQAVENANIAQAAAQEAYDLAEATFNAVNAEVTELESVANRKKQTLAEKSAIYEQAEADAEAAAEALSKNESDIEAAQGKVTKAQADQATADTEIATAQGKVDAAEQALKDAQDARDSAQADIEAEVGDPGSNEGHEEWTAYGFFKSIRDSAAANSAAYWDAQCAMDILDGGVNTTGHSYAENQGPEPDGLNAANWVNIANNIVWAQRGDAVGLDNMKTSLELLDEFNSIRGEENAAEGTSLRTDIGTNCRQMAISIVQCDTSKDSSVSHTQAYSGLENLSWSSRKAVPFSRSKYTDPYVGWYDEEKVNYTSNNGGVTGHYTTIVDLNNGYFCEIAGFAVANYEASLGECRELSTFGDFFNYDTNPTPEISYSVAEFSSKLDAYYDAQVEAGMFGTTDAVKAQHRQALEAANAQVEEAQATLEAAQAELKDRQDAKAAAVKAEQDAQAEVDQLQAETAGLQEAKDAAVAAAGEARDEAEAANVDYQNAVSAVNEKKDSSEYKEAAANLEAKTAGLATAKQNATSANEQLDAAKAALAAHCDLSVQSDDRFIEEIAAIPYTGKAVTPTPVVKVAGDTLVADRDYAVSYKNNENAGTATVIVTGKGDFTGTLQRDFSITPILVDVPNPCQWTYDGRAHYDPGTGMHELYEYGEGSGDVVAAGEYQICLTLSDPVNYRWNDGTASGTSDDQSIIWTIIPANLENATVTLDAVSSEYTGSDIEPTVQVSFENTHYEGDALENGVDYTVKYANNKNVGEATVTVTGIGNFEGSKTASFEITRKAITVKADDASKLFDEADDPEFTATVDGLVEGDDFELEYEFSREPGDAVGDYEITVTGDKLQGNYEITYVPGTFTILAGEISIPQAANGLVYTGSNQVGVAAGDGYEVKNGSATDAGTYTAVASLADASKYRWDDGTADDKEIAWSIEPASLAKADVTGIANKTYTGKAITQNPTVKLNGKTLKPGTDFTVSYANNTKAGTATATITGKGNYKGSIKKSFSIAKAANPLAVKAVAKTVKYSKVKKKAQVVTGGVKVTKKGVGTVTYAKASGSSAKLTINKSTGKITVKKGTKKGTYTIKVKVTAKGNANYKAGAKTVSVKVKVK